MKIGEEAYGIGGNHICNSMTHFERNSRKAPFLAGKSYFTIITK